MRIGIFGGSFNPVHVGHLIAAECAREQAGLDRVLFVPAALPPHKQDRPLAPSPGASPAPVAAHSQAAWWAAPPAAPPTLGVSREYAADLMAVPIRPPRILFGVWRN